MAALAGTYEAKMRDLEALVTEKAVALAARDDELADLHEFAGQKDAILADIAGLKEALEQQSTHHERDFKRRERALREKVLEAQSLLNRKLATIETETRRTLIETMSQETRRLVRENGRMGASPLALGCCWCCCCLWVCHVLCRVCACLTSVSDVGV